MRTLLGGLAISIGIYLILLLLIFLFQRSFLYQPDQTVPSELHLSKMGVSEISLQSQSNEEMRSLWRAPLQDSDPIILFLHGNAGSQYHRIPVLQAIANNGAGILIVGYPGYGGNTGSPSEQALYETAQTNFDWLVAQGISPRRIVIVGESLGSGVATYLATQNEAAGLIVIASYTGMDDMAQRQFPIFPARWLVKDQYRTIDRIDQINMPLSWIHGTADALIPFAMGQKLFDAAEMPKTAHAIEQGGHNDLWSRGVDDIVREEAERLVSGD